MRVLVCGDDVLPLLRSGSDFDLKIGSSGSLSGSRAEHQDTPCVLDLGSEWARKSAPGELTRIREDIEKKAISGWVSDIWGAGEFPIPRVSGEFPILNPPCKNEVAKK